jgi:hypothetical protein
MNAPQERGRPRREQGLSFESAQVYLFFAKLRYGVGEGSEERIQEAARPIRERLQTDPAYLHELTQHGAQCLHCRSLAAVPDYERKRLHLKPNDFDPLLFIDELVVGMEIAKHAEQKRHTSSI